MSAEYHVAYTWPIMIVILLNGSTTGGNHCETSVPTQILPRSSIAVFEIHGRRPNELVEDFNTPMELSPSQMDVWLVF